MCPDFSKSEIPNLFGGEKGMPGFQNSSGENGAYRIPGKSEFPNLSGWKLGMPDPGKNGFSKKTLWNLSMSRFQKR